MFSKYLQLSSCFTELKMNVEELMKAQAEALEMLADQQMRMIRDKEVQEALKEVKSPAAKRSVGGVLDFCLEK